MKVWLVMTGMYDDYGFSAAFSDKDKAEQYARRHEKQWCERHGRKIPDWSWATDIIEAEIDASI